MSTRKAPPNKRNLAIKESTSVADAPCALCGQPCYPFAGPELFLAESWDLVCWECGIDYAPELVQMLDYLWDDVAKMADEEERRTITPAA